MKESIKDNEQFFRKAFDLSPDAINVNRMHDGLYVMVNEGFTNISGYSKEELIGRSSLELNIWADPEDREKLVKGLKESGKLSNLETRFRMKSGEIRHGILSVSLRSTPPGSVRLHPVLRLSLQHTLRSPLDLPTQRSTENRNFSLNGKT